MLNHKMLNHTMHKLPNKLNLEDIKVLIPHFQVRSSGTESFATWTELLSVSRSVKVMRCRLPTLPIRLVASLAPVVGTSNAQMGN